VRTNFARPKSRILASPLSVTKMFAGLISRWMIPAVCAAVERVGDLMPRSRIRSTLRGLPSISLLQSATRQELHDNERMAFVLVHFVHGADIRVIEGGRSAGFS
jgi:hypothetical protein